jgi:hypothetical protein
VTWIAVAAVAAAVLGTLWRIFYGVDFIDEALYAATAYRFALGARPFVDDWEVHQIAGLIVSPYVRLHLAIFGDTTGIMLSLRFLWFALNGARAALWFVYLRRRFDWRVAAISSACALCVMPVAIPAMSFNTLPLKFSGAALALIGLGTLSPKRSTYYYAGAGSCFAVAACAYPTLTPAVLVALAGLWFVTRSWRAAAAGGAAGLVTALLILAPALPYVGHVGDVLFMVKAVAPMLNWGGNGVLAKFSSEMIQFSAWDVTRPAVVLGIATAAAILWRRTAPWWLWGLLALSLPVLFSEGGDIGSLFLTAGTVLVVGFIIAAEARHTPPEDRTVELRYTWFALGYAFLSGFTFLLTSSNGWSFFGVGSACVLPLALCLIYERLQCSVDGTRRGAGLGLILSVVAGAILVATFVWSNATYPYRDLPPLQEHSRVTRGPYAGLITSEFNKEGVELLWDTMSAQVKPSDRLLAYHGFPAAFLFTKAAPAVPIMWTFPYDAWQAPEATKRILDYVQQPEHRPTVIIKNLTWPSEYVMNQINPFYFDVNVDGIERWVEPNYKLFVKNKWFEMARSKN